MRWSVVRTHHPEPFHLLNLAIEMDAQALIASLRSQGVKSFKGYGIEVEFHPSQAVIPAPSVSIHPPAQQVTQQSAPDLSTPDVMSEEDILNWSAPAGAEAPKGEAVPMTGDAPLGEV